VTDTALRTSNTTLNKTGKSGHLTLIFITKGMLSTLGMIFAEGVL
jgi:hypothetical protein